MKVAVIMGSRSDFPVMQDAVNELKNFGIEVEYRIVSAHRTPEFFNSLTASCITGKSDLLPIITATFMIHH